ncbi:MAG: pseudouridine-5'-phosphate glycosidase [Caldiserica bacterium]|nr:pseudouridine-5'-phosphate glycosidase [Caldisericota bacterium]MDH7563010.1 pseudouridine-5'-phosphate glycosidase [Caldisericota bacterium]
MKSRMEFSEEVQVALEKREPVVALESTIFTHGLPYPKNLEAVHFMESAVRKEGAVPAVIALVEGKIKVGISHPELEELLRKECEKVQVSSLALAVKKKAYGSTTVSATIEIANKVGIKVMATGGIGGVHRGGESTFDISQDLTSLARTPICVVCSGAKAILDLPRTLELLETLGITVLGFRTPTFPAFYTSGSGLKVPLVSTPEDVAEIMHINWEVLKIEKAVLVGNPPPEEKELSEFYVEELIRKALQAAEKLKISGKELTPFLLSFLEKSSGGKTVETNIALAESNARLGAKIARAFLKIKTESGKKG